MEQDPSTRRQSQSGIWLALGAILLVGAGLRLYHLGYNSFWLDEAGVAYAARAASIPAMLEVVRSHVMAMPLDYLVVWLVGRISVGEFALRLPAAAWGTASLLLAWRLYRRFTLPSAALLGVLVLALSPLHIQYSQELRFYASLVFFYLLASLLLWDAIQQPTPKRWACFALAMVVGIYFHAYVLLALANGLVWLALTWRASLRSQALRVGYLLSATVSLLAFVIGYRLFSASNFFVIPLLVFEEAPVMGFASALGWLPFYPGAPALSWVWGVLVAALEISGITWVLRKNPASPLAGIFYAVLLQIAAVLGMDLVQHYFFAPRQLIMLLPLLCLFAGIGAQVWLENLRRFLARHASLPAWTAAAVIAALLVTAALPAIQAYYQDDKGDTRAILNMVAEDWRPGDSTLITPSFDGFVYQYYMQSVYQRADIAERLWGGAWNDVQKTAEWDGTVYLVTAQRLSEAEKHELATLGFTPRYQSYPNSRYAKTLWVRSPGLTQ